MQRLRPWFLVPVVSALAACGSSTIAGSAGDAAPGADALPGVDGGDLGPDAAPWDGSVSPDGAPIPDGPVLGDSTVLPDGEVLDVATPADGPPDAPGGCTNGLTDTCPAAAPGPCADLRDEARHTVGFGGLRHDYRLSCTGALTGMGPDGVVPLTITAASDVVLTGTPTGGDAVVLALESAAGCGTPRGEINCVNSSAGGMNPGQLRATGLMPGTYYVVVVTARGTPAIVQAAITPARMPPPGDRCPGVAVTPDGTPVTLDTTGFALDYGTSCGTGGMGTRGASDAVFSYTLTATRDVTLDVSATGMGAVGVDVQTTCGARASTLPGCASGNPAHRTLHNQAPGTYYVVADWRAMGPMMMAGRSVVATVTTAAPTPLSPAATCPGIALDAAGAATRVDVGALGPGTALPMCLAGQQAGAVFSFAAPAAGNDVLVNVAASNGMDDVALRLQQPCGGMPVGPCTGPGMRAADSVWARYPALSPGQTYFVQAGTSAATGSVSARYYTVPAATTSVVTNNDSCRVIQAIPETGGIFHGTTTATSAIVAPACGGMACAGGRTAFYQLTLTARRRVVAVQTSASFDTLLFIQSGVACPGTAVPNACNDDWYDTNSQVDVTLDAGTYWVYAAGCGPRAMGAYQLDVAVLPPG